MSGVPLGVVHQEAPHLLPLRQQADAALAATPLYPHHEADLVLALSAASSMTFWYETGAVQALAERVLAFASAWNPDGEVDVFFLGEQAWHGGTLTLKRHRGAIGRFRHMRELPFTEWGRGLAQIRRHRRGHRLLGHDRWPERPTFVLVVTDADPSDARYAARQVLDSCLEPVWWECFGIPWGERFGFLEALENPDDVSPDVAAQYAAEVELLRTRDLDNVHTFVGDLEEPELYQRMLERYPDWVEGTRGRLWGSSGPTTAG